MLAIGSNAVDYAIERCETALCVPGVDTKRGRQDMNRFRPSNLVLGLLCLMYFITYLDRVNVSTAAAGFAKEFNLNKTQIGLVF
jgi:hypothetical protein